MDHLIFEKMKFVMDWTNENIASFRHAVNPWFGRFSQQLFRAQRISK
jgi:hypothetical protein